MAERSTARSLGGARREKKSPSPLLPMPAAQGEVLLHKDMVRLARMVQESLLPPSQAEFFGFELAARFLPATNIAGDFFDYFPLGHGRLGLYYGDVQGKGLEAAMYGLVASGIMRGVHKSGTPPAEVLQLINRRLCYNSFPGKFSCLGYVFLDMPQRRLTFASAGVPFPLLVRDGTVTRIELTGTPLGLFEPCQIDQIELSLRRGDSLLFYTDGLPDSLHILHPEQGEGATQLENLLTNGPAESAAAVADRLMGGLQDTNHSDRKPGNQSAPLSLPDDATFVVIHFGRQEAIG